MPEEAYWDSFFDPQGVLDQLIRPGASSCNVVEFGCGGLSEFPCVRLIEPSPFS